MSHKEMMFWAGVTATICSIVFGFIAIANGYIGLGIILLLVAAPLSIYDMKNDRYY